MAHPSIIMNRHMKYITWRAKDLSKLVCIYFNGNYVQEKQKIQPISD